MSKDVIDAIVLFSYEELSNIKDQEGTQATSLPSYLFNKIKINSVLSEAVARKRFVLNLW